MQQMTNKEKFREVFGFDANPERFSICFIFDACDECPFYYEKNCIPRAKDFWDEEYKEKSNEDDKEAAPDSE